MSIKILLEKYRKASYAYSYGLRVDDGSVRAEQELENIARDLDEAGANLRRAVKAKAPELANAMSNLMTTQLFAQGSYLSALLKGRKEEWLAKTLADYNKAKADVDNFVKELE
ncbi:hypothetical protein VPA32_orf241 [Klebsiella phage vB_KpnM_VPA32]|jgi:hypothetical protein|nr:hypothetical protein ENTB43_199 [Enterobacter phage Entb_43]WJJ59206.1 hypothetical protein VPA32_orf241 [Klebsiella phage vB_KpnM_VPA32]WOF01368.1 hypothetical protein vBEnt31_000239 [Enterobacter phage vB_Ent31]